MRGFPQALDLLNLTNLGSLRHPCLKVDRLELTEQHLSNTELDDRTLWYDGDTTVSGDRIVELAAKYALARSIWVDEVTPEIQQYNAIVSEEERLHVKEMCNSLNFDWNIPEEFKQLDVVQYIFQLVQAKTAGYDEDQIDIRLLRTNEELKHYNRLGLFDVLRTLIYIINKLEEEQVVWGVGRGSSVSSYVLYLIGIHDVDSVQYELDINDFLREP
jgi:DNA polymerase III alpha subunit